MKRALTIAGSDSTGGAGIQADLKTFQEYGVFGISSLTAIVTMDPKQGWSHEVTSLSEELVEKQLVSAFAGQPIDALKTGMLGNERNIQRASQWIEKQQMTKLVVDPVIACKGTAQILQPESVVGLKRDLIPQALIVTPNLVEAGILSEIGDLRNLEMLKEAARVIYQQGAKNVVIKGGARFSYGNIALDLFYDGRTFEYIEGPLFSTTFNHGAGCTFSAAITAGLANGQTVFESIVQAKTFVAAAIQQGVAFNAHVGHVWHGAYNHAQERMKEVH
ncbi:bifunctional hydroxymethylpyrimidine kinase/phosphomethylpyrimidine kinase [Enterococcus sp. LJL98]